MFKLFLFKAGPVELGVGPQLTIDSATDDRARDRQVAGGRCRYCSGLTAMGYARSACYLTTFMRHARLLDQGLIGNYLTPCYRIARTATDLMKNQLARFQDKRSMTLSRDENRLRG